MHLKTNKNLQKLHFRPSDIFPKKDYLSCACMYPFSLRLHILHTPRIYKSKPDVNAFISFHYQKNQLSVQSKSNNRQSRMNSKEDTFFTLKMRFTLLFGSGRYFSGVVLRACSSIHVIRANLKKERTHYLCPSFHSTCLTIFPSDKRKE